MSGDSRCFILGMSGDLRYFILDTNGDLRYTELRKAELV